MPTFASAAAVLIVLTVAGIAWGDHPADAEVFEFRQTDEHLVIDVVGKIDDPGGAAAELRDEGLAVDLVAVPAAPWLTGDVVAVSSESGDPSVEESMGRVSSIQIDISAPVRLTLYYGRIAQSEEEYEATSSAPSCEEWLGAKVSFQNREHLGAEFGPMLRWQKVVGGEIDEISETALPSAATVLDIIPTSADKAIVIVADESQPPPPGMAC